MECFVNQLDRSSIDQAYRGSGSAAYDPVCLLKMVLYQYLLGNQSPAKWHQEARRNTVMSWLGRGYLPARRTWYDFRDRAGQFIADVHRQLVAQGLELGLDPSAGVQDGTTVAACASRHRVVTKATVEKRQEQLAAIRQGEFQGEEPSWVPPTDSGKQELAERLQQAAEVLAERIADNAKKQGNKRKDPAKIQVSLSDPEAPLGRDKQKIFRPLYTVQYMVAPGSHVILAYCCEPHATDVGTLAPMIDKTQQIVGDRLTTVLADASYCSIIDLRECAERNIDLLAPVQSNAFTDAKKKVRPPQRTPRSEFVWNEVEQNYRCPAGHTLEYAYRESKPRFGGERLWEYRYCCNAAHCAACPLAAACLQPGAKRRTIKRLEGQELLDAQRAKMAIPENQARYKLRCQTVELAYADCKYNRRLQRFHGRGLARARTETGLMVVAQNLLRLDRLAKKRPNNANVQT